MKPALVYKTYNPILPAKMFGEQYFIHSLIEDLVEERDNLDDIEGAIISIRASDNIQYVDQFNTDIARLKWCLIIVTGNENSSDFHKHINHPNCKIWIQTPKRSDEADYFIGFGYPNHMDRTMISANKTHDWGFAGQVNTSSRRECVEVLRTMKNGVLVPTKGFNQGLEYNEYMQMLGDAKYIPCPSAIATPDSFRIYEALEMDCVPVLDAMTSEYFERVWGESYLLGVSRWVDFKNFIESNIGDFTENQILCRNWWSERKSKIVQDLFNQISEIS